MHFWWTLYPVFLQCEPEAGSRMFSLRLLHLRSQWENKILISLPWMVNLLHICNLFAAHPACLGAQIDERLVQNVYQNLILSVRFFYLFISQEH